MKFLYNLKVNMELEKRRANSEISKKKTFLLHLIGYVFMLILSYLLSCYLEIFFFFTLHFWFNYQYISFISPVISHCQCDNFRVSSVDNFFIELFPRRGHFHCFQWETMTKIGSVLALIIAFFMLIFDSQKN